MTDRSDRLEVYVGLRSLCVRLAKADGLSPDRFHVVSRAQDLYGLSADGISRFTFVHFDQLGPDEQIAIADRIRTLQALCPRLRDSDAFRC